jgi:CIC family chloride channel protein
MRTHDRTWASLSSLGLPGWLLLLAVTAATGALARLVVERLAPESAGSGVPTVEARVEGGAPLRWRRSLPAKLVGGVLATATGMSLGPEGPSVHMGACIGEAWSGRSTRDDRVRRALVAAGAGAGLAAVFGAPIAGMVFVFEELRSRPTPLAFATAVLAALASRLVAGRLAGAGLPLGPVDFPAPGPTGLLLAAACGFACGGIGVLFNAAVVEAANRRDRLPVASGPARAALAACCAIPVGLLLPAAWFGDLGPLRDLALGRTVPAVAAMPALRGTVAGLAALAVVKLAFTATSYASGTVGGLFAPPLVIGGALGAIAGRLAEPLAPGTHLPEVLALAGASAVFTASVRVPFTGIVMLLELTGSLRPALAVGLSAVTARLAVAALRGLPIYEALATRRARAPQSA